GTPLREDEQQEAHTDDPASASHQKPLTGTKPVLLRPSSDGKLTLPSGSGGGQASPRRAAAPASQACPMAARRPRHRDRRWLLSDRRELPLPARSELSARARAATGRS